MRVKYRVRKKRSVLGKQQTKYHAVGVSSGEVDIKRLTRELCRRSSLSEGDVRSTLIGLVQLVEEYLHEGKSVRLDELGIFTLSVTSQGFDNPNDCTPKHVKANKICFRADMELKRKLHHVQFERDKEE